MSLSTETYATIVDAQQYLDGVINAESWELATNAQRTKALLNATRIMDRLNYLGEKASTSQELQFPRLGDSAVPDDIKCACAAIAASLLDGVDPELEFKNLQLLQAGLNGAKSTYDRDIVQPQTAAGLGSFTAWTFLAAYIIDVDTIEVSRV